MTSNRFKESRSQALQDLFVLAVSGKRNGFFLEIGGFHSEQLSNTYLLEKSFGWRGVTVEYLADNAAEIAANRTATVLCQDARTIRWSEKRADLGIPANLDYLQVDCEPALSSLIALWRVVRSGIRPMIITFEHDAYADSTLLGVLPQGRVVRWCSRLLLRGLGYTLAAGNVATDSGKPFEDWWILDWQVRPKGASNAAITFPDQFMHDNDLYASYERLAKAPKAKTSTRGARRI
jgi:hypothetical protein